MTRQIPLLLVAAASLLTLSAAPTLAARPSVAVIAVDHRFVPPGLSAACGFPVTRRMVGTLTVRTFFDARGNYVKELDQYHLRETVSANGVTLVARTIQNIKVTVLADGSYTVAFVGSDFRLPVGGAGIAFGSVGRLVLLFDASNNLLDVLQDVGDVRSNTAAACGALAG